MNSRTRAAAGSERKQETRRPNFIDKINRVINNVLERLFESLGRNIGTRPILVIIGAIIVAVGLGTGILRLENETRGDKLWVPTDNLSQKNAAFVNKHYPPTARVEFVYLLREDGGNVLTPEAFSKALEIHEDIIALQWDNLKVEDNPESGKAIEYLPESLQFQDLCANREKGEGAQDWLNCSIGSPIEIFGYDEAAWSRQDAILETLNNRSAWNADLVSPGFVLDTILGGLEQEGGQVTGAKVLAMQYLLASNDTLEEEQQDDVPAMGWEQVFLDRMEELDEADSVWHVQRRAVRSFDDEFGSTLDSDLQLLQVAIIAIIVFTYAAISVWQDGCVGSRSLLTIGGILNIGLAVLSSYGFASYIGLLFTPLMSILPFIMLGVGVDGMFVLQSALDATDPEESMPERMAVAMRTGGLSVAVASLTNFGAFMIGSNTSLPALSAFSIYAALGLLFNLFLQITFFSGIMCVDKARQERRKFDVALCFTSKGEEHAGYCCGLFKGHKDGFRVRGMKWLGRQYTKKPVKAVVVVMWLGLLAAGIYGSSQMYVDADVNNFLPEGSYTRVWLATLQREFGETGNSVQLYWINDVEAGRPLNFSDPVVQEQMDNSLEVFQGNEYVVGGTLESWWLEMTADGPAPGVDFYPALRDFLSTPRGARYQQDLVFMNDDSTQELISARSSFRWRYMEETTVRIKALDSMRGTESAIEDPLGSSIFTHSNEYLNIEQYKSIGKEALLNIGLGFLMIAVVVLLLVANPVAAILTFLCVASAILELVGFMQFRGTYIDSISVIFLVISLGLAVDYSVHVAHGYLSQREDDPAVRLEKTMERTGAAVLNGVLSTLIAALCLSGSGTYVFITFFYALLFIVLCGAVSGLVVLPVLLDMFRPAPHSDIAKQLQGAGQQPTDSQFALNADDSRRF